ncbi:hypothetical protein K435DRAFT_728949 [Dendrothele bispora CBS 962.96]|uniref:RBR-type E3 ubiquitin transferase n=1 Tax=Dendrothele bispora (strain CBS 962.96) TaxID=1314807 RepID=A0A4S8LL45_DENBC|nr:hypothetical protein K435DRAFT_728949 [Dendrothele bispora CBS 962.96]
MAFSDTDSRILPIAQPTTQSAPRDINRHVARGFARSNRRHPYYSPLREEGLERNASGFGGYQQGRRPQTPKSWLGETYPVSRSRAWPNFDWDSESGVPPPVFDSDMNRPGPSRAFYMTPSPSSSNINPSVPSRTPSRRSIDSDSWASSMTQRTPSTPNSESAPECIACAETISSYPSFTAPCGHHYCRTCLENYINLSLKDDSSFPPQCCRQPFPLGLESNQASSSRFPPLTSPSVSSILPNPELIRGLKARVHELSVPSKDRLYCPNPRCSVFLGSLNVPWTEARPVPVLCCLCGANACLRCKWAAHPGSECPPSPDEMAESQVRKLAKEKKWQTCPQCKETVERTMGCSHMVCRCNAHFCYGCGSDLNRGKGCVCGSQMPTRPVRRRASVKAVRTRPIDHVEPGLGMIPAGNGAPRRISSMISQRSRSINRATYQPF